MTNSYTLTDVIMTQSYGMKNNMPSSAENGRLLIARVNNGISEIWGGTGSGVELLSGAKVDLSNLSQTGESHFANPSLSNLNSIGESKFQKPIAIGIPQFTLDFMSPLPDNCIWLEGAEVSRVTYANLFAIYGTTYGEGNGTTTFNLPDCRNRVLWGGSEAGYISAGLPNITGTMRFNGTDPERESASSTGCITTSFWTTGGNDHDAGIGHGGVVYDFNASRSSSIYGNSTTVQPPAIKVRVYTRYQ